MKDPQLYSTMHVDSDVPQKGMLVEKGVPIPPANRAKDPDLNERIKSLFSQMAVGDSFLVPVEVVVEVVGRFRGEDTFRSCVSALATAYRGSHEEKAMFQIATRKQPEGLRIWRVR